MFSICLKLFLCILFIIIVFFLIISLTALLTFNASLKELLPYNLPENFNQLRRDIFLNILFFTLPGLFLSFGLAYFVARFFTRPLTTFILGVKQIEKGEQVHPLEVRRSYEFGMLAESFNRMAVALDERDSIISGKGAEIEARKVLIQEMNELLGEDTHNSEQIEVGCFGNQY